MLILILKTDSVHYNPMSSPRNARFPDPTPLLRIVNETAGAKEVTC